MASKQDKDATWTVLRVHMSKKSGFQVGGEKSDYKDVS